MQLIKKKSGFIFLIFIFLFGTVSATISNVHTEPLYPNLSSDLIKVYADVSDVSKATLYYKINDDTYSSPFSVLRGAGSIPYGDILDNLQVFYWIETTNLSGNKESTQEFSFTYDGSAPVISILGENPLTIEINSTYQEFGATALDSVYGDLTSSITITGEVNISALGEYIITYTISDLAGNTATATRTVRVIEPIPVSSPSNNAGGSGTPYSASSSGGNNSIIIINDTGASNEEEANVSTEETQKKGFLSIVGSVVTTPFTFIFGNRTRIFIFAVLLLVIAGFLVFKFVLKGNLTKWLLSLKKEIRYIIRVRRGY